MKSKLFKPKSVIAIALALFMVMPMLFAALPVTKAIGTAPVLSVVQDGTTSGLIPSMPIGSSFTVDIYINNTQNVSPTINAISVALSFNAAVLQCTSTTDGTLAGGAYLPHQQALGDLAPDNINGLCVWGLICLYTPQPQAGAAPGSSGVVATATFQVIAGGSSNLAIAPTGAGIAYLDSPNPAGQSIPIIGTTTTNAQYNPVTSISLYQTGTSSSTIQYTSPTNPIGQVFGVDIYMSNPLAVPIWAWNVGLTWNAAALQFLNATEGTYLNSTGSTFFVPGYADNNLGTIPQGISDIYLTNMTTSNPAGILATVYFQVINYQNSPINLVSGIPTLLNNYDQPITPVLLNNATYITEAPPAPVRPVAVINQLTTGNPYTQNQPISFSSTGSTGGSDVIPNPASPNFPITTYTWTISPSITGVAPTNSPTLSFTAPTVAGLTPYTVTLTVATAETQLIQTITMSARQYLQPSMYKHHSYPQQTPEQT